MGSAVAGVRLALEGFGLLRRERSLWKLASVPLLLCAGILALFTDVEISVVEWINCGPLAPEVERRSEACRNRR